MAYCAMLVDNFTYMRKFKLIDNRHSLIEKATEAGYDAVQGDYFEEAVRLPHHVLTSASNPHFSFGGGLDVALKHHFPFYCKQKQIRGGGNERIGNMLFLVTVDFKLDSNKQLVRDALIFARNNTLPHETLCICGLGTMIGGLKEEVFIELLKDVFPVVV